MMPNLRHTAPKAPHPGSGFTLIELLIAMALGLLVVFAVGTVYVSTKQTFRVQDNNSRLQETGRFALEILGQQLRMAGYTDITGYPEARTTRSWRRRFRTLSIMGCQGGYMNALTSIQPSSCVADPNGNDSVLIQYQTLPDPTDPTAALVPYNAANGAGSDCLGQNPGGGGVLLTTNVYRVANGALSCMGRGAVGTWQPIFPGIEQMRVRFGVDSDRDQMVDAYLRPGNAYFNTVTNHDNIRSVEICLVVSSDEDKVTSGASQPIRDCDGATLNPTDGRIRRVFRSVYHLPNMISETVPTLRN